MPLATFFAGCVVGAMIAMLLTHESFHESFATQTEIPLSIREILSQIRSGWRHPASLVLAVLQHPCLLLVLLSILLLLRRSWRLWVIRPLWLEAPSVLKATLELHSWWLGAATVAAHLAAAHRMARWDLPNVSVDPFARMLLLVREQPILQGLAFQAMVPIAIHPGLLPAIARRFVDHASYTPAAAARHATRFRTALRYGYGMALLLSVLWILPLTLEAGVRWWQEGVLSALSDFFPDLPGALIPTEDSSTGGQKRHIRFWRRASVASGNDTMSDRDLSRAARAAATLETLAYFAMARRIGKTIDLQIGHYYRHKDARESARDGNINHGGDGESLERVNPLRARPAISSVPSLRREFTRVTVGRRSSLLRTLRLPRWLKSYVRSLRWLAITCPTYLFWRALSLELAASPSWRRLLLPTLFFALNECGQAIRLLTVRLMSALKLCFDPWAQPASSLS